MKVGRHFTQVQFPPRHYDHCVGRGKQNRERSGASDRVHVDQQSTGGTLDYACVWHSKRTRSLRFDPGSALVAALPLSCICSIVSSAG